MSDNPLLSNLRDPAIFRAAVRERFGALEARGFRPLEFEDSVVRYAKPGVEVVIFHDRHSYEVVLEFHFDGEIYSLSEILRIARPQAKEYRRWAAQTEQEVVHGLSQLADLLQESGSDALDGKAEYVERLRQQRKEWAKSLAMEVRAGQTRPKAEEAFRLGEFTKAAGLYAQIEDALSTAERTKLAVARRRAAEQED
jgi:hypothetical protein